MMDKWLHILEDHFRIRRKAFLVFDEDLKLMHISEFAKDILEIDDDQLGLITLTDLFPAPKNTPNYLLDLNETFHTFHDVTYTTPSGRPKDIRLTFNQPNTETGYVVWLEAQSRDITATYRKVSTFDSYVRVRSLFDTNEMGVLIIDKDGTVITYNGNMKSALNLPGDWQGKNIFSLPLLHQSRLMDFFKDCMQDTIEPRSRKFRIRKSGQKEGPIVLFSGIAIPDPNGEVTGIMVTLKIIKNENLKG